MPDAQVSLKPLTKTKRMNTIEDKTGLIDNTIKPLLQGQALRYQVSQTMFCPVCQQCMDWNLSVGVDIYRTSDDKLVYTKCFCTRCYDNKVTTDTRTADDMGKKLGYAVRIETIDGRDYDEDGVYDPVHPEAGIAVEFLAARKGKPEKVSGNIVNGLPGWAKFAVYHSKELWFLVELSTGYAVARGETQHEAMLSGARRLNSVGQETFLKSMRSVPAINPQF